jgi:hypothetical protein
MVVVLIAIVGYCGSVGEEIDLRQLEGAAGLGVNLYIQEYFNKQLVNEKVYEKCCGK